MDEKVHLCPECGSSAVDYSSLVGGPSSCRNCEWKGTRDELLTSVVSHDFSGPEQVASAFSTDLRNVIARELAEPLVKTLGKWGFFTNPKDLKLTSKEAALYIQCAARAMAVSLLKTREFVAVGKVKYFKETKDES